VEELDYLHILCPPWGFSTPPLGPAYVIESLRASGISARFIDISALLLKHVLAQPHLKARIAAITGVSDPKKLWSYSSLPMWHTAARLDDLFWTLWPALHGHIDPHLSLSPKVVGFSIYRDNLYFSTRTARALREHLGDAPIIFGGPWIRKGYDRDAVPRDAADLLIFGEAEEILPEVLKGLLAEPGRSRRKALKRRLAREIVAPPVDLDRVPYPTYEGFDFDLYQKSHACAMTTRGCTKRCNFCIDWILGRRYRERDVSNVLDELEMLAKELGVKVLVFNDLNLGINVERLRAMARGIVERGIELAWDANLSVSDELDERTFEVLAKSGARTLQFGIESGSERILKLMGKDYTPELARKVLEAAHKAGVETMINLIVGYPSETKDEFDQTTRFFNETADFIHKIGAISTLHIIPMTDLAKQVDALHIRSAYHREPVEHYWEQDGLDLGTRIERAYRLVALARKHGLGMIQTNADIDRMDFRHRLGRDVFEDLPLSVKRGRLVRVGPTNFELRAEQGGESVELKLNPNYSAVKCNGRLIRLEPEGIPQERISVRTDRLLFAQPVGGQLSELEIKSKSSKGLDFLIEQRLPESVDVRVRATCDEPVAATITARGKPYYRTPTARNGELSVKLANRELWVLWRGGRVTSFPHLYFGVDAGYGDELRSFDGDWFYRHASAGSALVASVTWRDVDFRFLSEVEPLEEGRIRWKLFIEAQQAVRLRRFKAGVALDDGYNVVGTERNRIRLKKAGSTRWAVVGPRDKNGRLPLDPKYSGSADFMFASSNVRDLPKVIVRSLNSGGYLPVIQSGCEVGPGLGFYARDVTFKPGKTLALKAELDVR